MRRVFEEAFHVTPIQYVQTCRLLLAKSLLTDTNLSVLDVAMAAGFGSLRRMNALFKTRYHLTPTTIRRSGTKGSHPGHITLGIGYRPPYLWARMLQFLAERSIAGVEVVAQQQYMRTVQIQDRNAISYRGWIMVGQNEQKHMLMVTISESLIPVVTQVLTRVKYLFDVACDPDMIDDALQVMNQLQPGLCMKGIRVPGCFDPFEMSVRAILGQQISVKAASTLAARIAQTYGLPIDTGIAGLTHTFPTAAMLFSLPASIEECFGVLGVISARSKVIYALAQAMEEKHILLDMSADPIQEMQKLQELHGIGSWTAQYLAMRTMGWTDAFLETDVGVKKALPGYSSKELLELSQKWRPWRSYATISLWNSLS